jgi:hypothetical protein
MLLQDRSVWTFVLFGVSVNSGGILNGIRYHLNEGWNINLKTPNNTEVTEHNCDDDQPEQIIVTTTELTECNQSDLSISSFSSPSLDNISRK